MDAHAFRCLCYSLQSLLLGARVEKIQRPTPDLHVFTVYAGGQKRFLMLRSGRQSPLLFFASHKLPAPQEPTAVVMRLRRYCAGRRIKSVCYDWLGRKIGLLMHHDPETWLVLDLRHGPSLASDFSENPCLESVDNIDLEPLCATFEELHGEGKKYSISSLQEPALWRNYAFMTPSLRKTLVHLAVEDPAEAAALVVDVLTDMEPTMGPSEEPIMEPTMEPSEEDSAQGKSCNLFVYCQDEIPSKLSAWPLPKSLQSHDKEGQKYIEHHFQDAIEATSFFGQGVAFSGISEDAQRLAVKPFTNEANRLKRLLVKLHSEEKRLQKMLAQRDEAVALQGILYQLSADAKLSSIEIPQKDGAPSLYIKLNPLRTVRENMADMFHQSRRGERGLAILAQRRADITAQEALALHEVRDITTQKNEFISNPEAHAHHDSVRFLQQEQATKREQKKNGQQNKAPNSKKLQTKQGQSVKNQALATKYVKIVESFQSCDGIRLLRGRNAEGNAAVLKMAQPYDIWMHSADGPSAHLIVKRDHAQHDVPQTTLEEAAQLVALKSWQRHDAQAEIMCAYAKDVRAIKGAAAGKVRVERSFMALTVRLPEL